MEGRVNEFDPGTADRYAQEKLAALRAAIRAGLESGPAEPFDIEAIIAEARAARSAANGRRAPRSVS
jgi:Arc/MetJ-type ribon-helix-helix transcriptional regulator